MVAVHTSSKTNPAALPQEMMEGLRLTGYEDESTRRLMLAAHMLRKTGRTTLSPVLPVLLNLKGDPYTLKDHFPFTPFFRTRVPQNVVLKTGRQVSKSTSLASQGVVISNCIPYFSTLYVTPLYEMIRRFSNNYVRPFIETSPVRKLLTGTTTVNSVLQRSFKNMSQMIFSFAFLDAERTRGVSADKMAIDEVQDLDPDFIPIIREVMSHSKWGLSQFAGTPKTLSNTIEGLWQSSSMAEWVIKCHHGGCGHFNVPCLSHDLVKMIGPIRDDISESEPGVVCAECQKPILPRPYEEGGFGEWIHANPSLRWDFAGYHVPQIVMPLHYNSKQKWAILHGKMEGVGNTPIHVFYNEVCGESYDSGAALITQTDLKACAHGVGPNTIENAIRVSESGRYIRKILSVDWGGGGEQGVSFTTLAALGQLPNGDIEVFYGHRSLTPHDHLEEARLCLDIMRKLKLSHVIHDYTGAGALRETFIIQSGFPIQNVIPIAYIRTASGDIMSYKAATETHPRNYYQVDKARSLLLTAQTIKLQRCRMFDYDFKGKDNRGLMHDFLALVEDKVDSRAGKDIYTIIRNPQFTDDFAQAVNIGQCALWYMSRSWPNLADVAKIKTPRELLDAAHPLTATDWDDLG